MHVKTGFIQYAMIVPAWYVGCPCYIEEEIMNE
jgi:hypothetical protein